jgi:hypothetical protein
LLLEWNALGESSLPSADAPLFSLPTTSPLSSASSSSSSSSSGGGGAGASSSGVEWVCSALHGNRSVTCVDLRNNKLNDRSAAALAALLARNQCITSLGTSPLYMKWGREERSFILINL